MIPNASAGLLGRRIYLTEYKTGWSTDSSQLIEDEAGTQAGQEVEATEGRPLEGLFRNRRLENN